MDSNAAVGFLAEVFTVAMTTSQARCAGCGPGHVVEMLLVYGRPMGTIMRGPGCTTTMIRSALVRDEYILVLRGTRALRLLVEATTAPG